MNRLLLFIVFIVSSLVCGHASTNLASNYRFRTFSPKGGFYYDGVIDITQDNEGFIWIILNYDLLRFDGHEYKKYSSFFQKKDTTDICHFHSLAKDTAGCLHIMTDHGIYKRDKRTDAFQYIMPSTSLTHLGIDRKNRVWSISGNQLYRVDLEEKRIIPCLYEGKETRSISKLCYNEKEIFFCSRYNRIYHYSYDNSNEIALFHLLPHDHTIADIAVRGKYLYVLTKEHGIIRIDTGTKEVTKTFALKELNKNIPVKTFLIDKNDNAWIGTQRGLYVLDTKTEACRLYLHSKADPFSLPNNSIWTLFCDNHENIWTGHYAGGLCYVNLNDRLQTKTYTPTGSDLNHELVSSFAEDSTTLYIGTEGGGVNCLDKQKGSFSFLKQEKSDNSLSYNNVKSLALDKRGRLWIAMYRGGLDCYEPAGKRFRHFRHNPKDSCSLYVNDLRKVVLEGDSGLWTAYQTNQAVLSFFSFNNEKFTHYRLGEGGYVFDLQKDNAGHLYALTRTQLYRLNIADGKSEKIGNSKIPNGQTCCIDPSGRVWIGTIGHGLICYNPADETFTSHPDILSHGASAIYSIFSDTTHFLWMGTDNGAFRLDMEANTYQRFDESDGFQGAVYYPLASLKNDNGQYYFGGTNGFTIFTSKKIEPNPEKPRVRISEFYIDNQPAVAAFREKGKPEMVLNYDQANFGFKFSSDNYLSPDKNKFKYRLRGYDNHWITTNATNRTVMYSKVPAGSYHLEILAANNDGVWSDTPTIIKITRRPAPWAGLPAYLLYTAIVLSIATVFFYHWNEKRKLRMQLYINTLEQQKKEELHQSQLRFFTNISHDFKTPLSLILAVTDNLKQEGVKEYYRILYNNAHRLLNLVNELMDFRTIENNKMKLHVEKADVNQLVKDLAADFNDYAGKRSITFRTGCDAQLPARLAIDKQIIEKVVMNLLNNAFKYTGEGGSISIETYANPQRFTSQYAYSHHVAGKETAEEEFLLVVRDTGVGISKESIKEVFERFYTVNSVNLHQHLGTGIGLALVKSLVLLHKGRISIFSEREKGTDMLVYFPANASVYSPAEMQKVTPSGTESPRQVIETKALPKMELPESETATSSRKRILIVEDNDDLRVLLSGFLSLHYDTLEAKDGMEAAELLKEKETDLILSDIMMPRKDGITLCRELKADISTSHIPLILLTAKSGPEAHLEGSSAGADLYFAKPVDFNLLLQSIHNIFRHQCHLREYYAKHYYAESADLSGNKQDADFLKKLTGIIDKNIEGDNIDVNYVAAELCMSRSKLYSKLKALTGKSIVEFILNYRMRKAATLIVEQDIPLYQVMELVGIRSQSYFVNAFKKEFGETPSAFKAKQKADSTETN